MADYKAIGDANIPYVILVDGDGNPVQVTPAGAAAVTDGQSVPLWNASDDSRGNGAAFVNSGFLTAVRLPPQNDVVGDGATKPLSKADNTGLLAMVTAHVPADTNTFESVALPANYALIQDGVGSIDILDYGSGGGQVAGIARVSGNTGNVQLANSTTKVAINAAPCTVVDQAGKTAGATFAVDQGNWQNFPLTNGTDALVSDGQTIPVTGAGTTLTLTVANGVVTGALS
ncbi:hypothetical protein [Brucella sp. IR073]|uniref:hypothetical protein n=1 Tax=unclassified Brucella TaxID=2632610 RepID=UPI003B9817D8